jgi:hypothetical protein
MKPAILGLTLIILGACRSANGGGAQTPAPGPPTKATVHELLASNALVGRMVEVTGRCLGYSSPTVAQGSPPVTRSDWQLEDGGEAIWVTGPMPDGCTATEPATEPSSIQATVAQDELPDLGGYGKTQRRYLVRK